MKKSRLKILLIVALVFIGIIVVFVIQKSTHHQIPVTDIKLLINCDLSDENIINSSSYICNIDIPNKTGDAESPVKGHNEILLSLKLANGSMCIVERENGAITSSIITDEGVTEKKLTLDWLPERILEFDNGIVFKHNSDLFIWRYEVGNEVELLDISDKYNDGRVFSNNDSIAFFENGQLHVYSKGKEKILRNTSQCLGFRDEENLVLVKELPFGFVWMYQYNINKRRTSNYKLLWVPEYFLFEAAFDPSGRYMLYFSSNGEGAVETYIMDLKSNAKKIIDFETDIVISAQWLS